MNFEENEFLIEQTLEDWVMDKTNNWREHYESNYKEKFDEYYRLWRGIWDGSDSMRSSERSKIISPALQQAVESSVAEVEEATFGRGKWFDLKDNKGDTEALDVQLLRNLMTEDFEYCKVRKAVAECILNSAIFGTGVGEVVLEETTDIRPATQPVMDGQATAVGVEKRDRTVVKLRPVLPQNFLIDPAATSIDEALGVAIDEFVPLHQVETMQERGIYRDEDIVVDAPDTDLEPDQSLNLYSDDKVRLTKYYGLVPRYLFEDATVGEDEEIVALTDEEDESKYVEAIVVIANGGTLLKAEINPYMMQDRPVVAFAWDAVPSRFWGRGVCEKGYNSQKALDTELRARIDALALTVHPMMAVDASRLPRGTKMEIRPGKTVLTNGNPAEILQPFKFGNLDPNTFNQAASLQAMVQQATGAIDSAGIAGSINGEGTAAGISMSLGAIIKRHKRTLINFQESFLLPFVRKAAYRYMQFDPERYPVSDYQFTASSSLGIIAREYEVTQLVQLLQTMSPESPLYPTLIESIVDNMNLANREELIARLKEASQPDPQQQQMAMQQAQAQMAMQQAQTSAYAAQAADFMARAEKYKAEAAVTNYDSQTDRIKVLSSNLEIGDADDREFEKRARVAELILKEQAINMKGNNNANAQTGLGDLGQPQQSVEQPQQSGPTIEPAMRGAGRENQNNGGGF
jgi:hypothetical protein